MEQYKTKKEAEINADMMRETGWPNAEVVENGEYYNICVHNSLCKCGRCPHLQRDGYVD